MKDFSCHSPKEKEVLLSSGHARWARITYKINRLFTQFFVDITTVLIGGVFSNFFRTFLFLSKRTYKCFLVDRCLCFYIYVYQSVLIWMFNLYKCVYVRMWKWIKTDTHKRSHTDSHIYIYKYNSFLFISTPFFFTEKNIHQLNHIYHHNHIEIIIITTTNTIFSASQLFWYFFIIKLMNFTRVPLSIINK